MRWRRMVCVAEDMVGAMLFSGESTFPTNETGADGEREIPAPHTVFTKREIAGHKRPPLAPTRARAAGPEAQTHATVLNPPNRWPRKGTKRHKNGMFGFCAF